MASTKPPVTADPPEKPAETKAPKSDVEKRLDKLERLARANGWSGV